MDRKDQPFDVVEKPAHYNSHPSKVETQEVTNYLSFNIGNVFKYVMRRDLKEPVRSLKSSQWYLRKAIEHHDVPLIASEQHREYVLSCIQLIQEAEPSLIDAVFYLSFRRYLEDRSKFNEIALTVALENVLSSATLASQAAS